MTQAVWQVLGRVTVNSKAVQRVRHGHPWIYVSDIVDAPATPAGLVQVAGDQGRVLGHAFVSPLSTIRVRLVTSGDVPFTRELLHARLAAALQRRERLLPNCDAYRLVHGEADFLPGIFVDRYADCLALQTTCAAAAAFEPELVTALQTLCAPRAIVLRNDAATRAHEKLPREIKVAYGAAPVLTQYHEGNIALQVDLLGDQKTGSFLDQAHNHVRAGHYARGIGLDCFTYHGGFAMQLAQQCSTVTAYDISAPALTRAQANAQNAGLTNIEFVKADMFEALPALLQAGSRFDTIVLDPPAFASGKHTVDAARRAYKEINLRAMKLLRPNSVLISCSCSGRVTAQDFDEVLAQAARDARRPVHFIERRAAGPDHPVLADVPETDYLKCRVLMVL